MRKGKKGKKFADSNKTEGSEETPVEKHVGKIQHLNEKGGLCEENEEPPKVLIKVPPSNPEIVCKLCFLPAQEEDSTLKLGPLYQFGYCCAHLYCLMFSSGLDQGGEDDEEIQGFLAKDIVKEWRRGSQLKCVYCKEKYATVGCVGSNCKKTYHLPCGLKNNSLQLFSGSFASHCDKHRPIQAILKEKGKKNKKNEKNSHDTSLVIENCCGVCLEELEEKPTPAVLWTPCCGGWFHRSCLERYAESAGCHAFQCSLCKNKDEFQKEMVEFGIYVPDQDAVWETEAGAFEDQYERHGSCDADVCVCPEGRKKDVDWTEWEIMLCYCCGSQGIHVTCGGLNIDNPRWKCDFCKAIVKNISSKPVSVFSKVNHKKTAGVFCSETSKLVLPAKETVENLLKRMTFSLEIEDEDEPSEESNVVKVELRKGHKDHGIVMAIDVDLVPAIGVPEQVNVKKEKSIEDPVIDLDNSVVKDKGESSKKTEPEYVCEYCDFTSHSKGGLKRHITFKHSTKKYSDQVEGKETEEPLEDDLKEVTIKRKREDLEDFEVHQPNAKASKICTPEKNTSVIEICSTPNHKKDQIEEDSNLDNLDNLYMSTPVSSTPLAKTKVKKIDKSAERQTTQKNEVSKTPKNGEISKNEASKTPKNGEISKTPKNGEISKTPKNGEVSKTPKNGSAEKPNGQTSIKNFFQKTPTDAPKNQPSIAMFFKKTPTPTFGTPKWTADLSKSPILRKPLSPFNIKSGDKLKEKVLKPKEVTVNVGPMIPIPKEELASIKSKEVIELGDSEFNCETCHKSFSDESSLLRHKISHISNKFQCKFCKIIFSCFLTWKKHENSHEDTQIKCAICEETFKTEKSLNSHNKKNHEKVEKDEKTPKAKTNFCEFCDFSTGYKHSLKHHMEAKHSKKKATDTVESSGLSVIDLLYGTKNEDEENVESMDVDEDTNPWSPSCIEDDLSVKKPTKVEVLTADWDASN